MKNLTDHNQNDQIKHAFKQEEPFGATKQILTHRANHKQIESDDSKLMQKSKPNRMMSSKSVDSTRKRVGKDHKYEEIGMNQECLKR